MGDGGPFRGPQKRLAGFPLHPRATYQALCVWRTASFIKDGCEDKDPGPGPGFHRSPCPVAGEGHVATEGHFVTDVNLRRNDGPSH